MFSALKSPGVRVLSWLFPLIGIYLAVAYSIGLTSPLTHDAADFPALADHGAGRIARVVFLICAAGIALVAIADLVLQWRVQRRARS